MCLLVDRARARALAVVRFTNVDVVVQVVFSKIGGDHVMTAAYSHELPRYGVKAGLTNYAAGDVVDFFFVFDFCRAQREKNTF